MTKKMLISDVILRISAGKPSDDLELEPRQVAFWIDQVLNALVKKTLDERIQKGNGVDPVYLCPEYNKQVNVSQNNGTNFFYIDLDHEPMNLHRDGGIARVANNDGLNVVNKVKIEELDNLVNLKMSKPSIKNIKYSRIKNRLYIYGLDSNTYQINTFDIVYVPMTKALEELKDNDLIYVGEDLIPIIAEAVTQIAKDELFNSFDDLDNDAVEAPVASPAQTQNK